MSNDNVKLDRAEALAVIIAQAVRAMRCKLPSMKLRNQKDPNENGSIKSTKSGQELITGRKKDDCTQAT
jgi:hypothetical protein